MQITPTDVAISPADLAMITKFALAQFGRFKFKLIHRKPGQFSPAFLFVVLTIMRNRVIALSTPGVAADQAAEGQPRAADGAVALESLERIGRTAGVEPARRGPTGEEATVAPDHEVQDAGDRAHRVALPTVAARSSQSADQGIWATIADAPSW